MGGGPLAATGAALGALLVLRRPLAFGTLLRLSLLAKETALLLPCRAGGPAETRAARLRRVFRRPARRAPSTSPPATAVLGELVVSGHEARSFENPLGVLPLAERVPAARSWPCARCTSSSSRAISPRTTAGPRRVPCPRAAACSPWLRWPPWRQSRPAVIARGLPRSLMVIAVSSLLVSNIVSSSAPPSATPPLLPTDRASPSWRRGRRPSLRTPLVVATRSCSWRPAPPAPGPRARRGTTTTRCAAPLSPATPRSVKVLGNLAWRRRPGPTAEARLLLDRAGAAPDAVPLLLNRASLACARETGGGRAPGFAPFWPRNPTRRWHSCCRLSSRSAGAT